MKEQKNIFFIYIHWLVVSIVLEKCTRKYTIQEKIIFQYQSYQKKLYQSIKITKNGCQIKNAKGVEMGLKESAKGDKKKSAESSRVPKNVPQKCHMNNKCAKTCTSVNANVPTLVKKGH